MKPIIILTGPVGAGKSTIAPHLVMLTPGPVAYIEGDKFWKFIAKGEDEEDGFKNFKMVMRSMLSASVHYAVNDYEVILDFSIPPWYMDAARKVAKFRDVPLHYVVIRPSEAICAARAAARPEGAIIDYRHCRDLYKSFDDAQAYTIHNDDADPATIAGYIREGIIDGIFKISE